MNVAIVTPSYNPGRFFAETLRSVLSQAGDFSLAYHVQDACSTDGSLDLLRAMVDQVQHGNLPLQCRRLRVSFATEPDSGMYDAINRGFTRLLAEDVDLMLWINADDRLAEGALAALVRHFRLHPQHDWVIGRTLQCDASGNHLLSLPPNTYRRYDLAAGRHDGMLLPFVTQEASAWRRQLWDRCGPLDSSLRYAGDYEYWKRAAAQGFELQSIPLDLGWHRKRPGQLSSDGGYKDEINLVKLRQN